MRKISYFIIALFALAACTKGTGTLYKEKSDDGKEIHFLQKAVTKEFTQGLTEGTILVDIARPGKTGTYAVWLNLIGDDKAHFSVPGKVEIKDGEYNAPVAIKVDLASLMVGSDYKATLYIYDRESQLGPDATWDTQFVDKMDIKVSFALEWEEYNRVNAEGETVRQTATYHYNAFYSGNDGGLTVDKAVGANIFRVNDWASGVSFRFILNADNTCVVPAQSIGFYNSNYNEYVQVSDMAVYTGNPNAYASYPCTYDGKGKFTFNLIYFVTGGYFAKGEETLTFDGEVDMTPTVKIVYEGIAHTLQSAVAMLSGCICDGAKASCASKIAMGVGAGILGYNMYRTGNNFQPGHGIVGTDVEDTVRNVGVLASQGMRETDRVILKIMTK